MTLDRTRARYAAIGICMAVVWLGEGRDPAWEHALRTAVMLLMVPPLLLRTQRRLAPKIHQAERPGRTLARLIATRIVVLAAAFAVSHLLGCLLDPGTGHSLVMPVVALLLAVLTIPWQIRRALRGRVSAAHPATRPALSAPRLIAAKLTLVIAAVLAQLLLGPCLRYPDAVVAVAMAVTVTALGPRIHARLLVPRAVGDTRPARAAV